MEEIGRMISLGSVNEKEIEFLLYFGMAKANKGNAV